jgi:large subunit ribosomal protein L25
MKLVSSPETVIAHSVALRAEEVVEPTAAEAAAVTPEAGATPAEPEVIKKGKKEEEAPAEEKEKGKKK